MTEKEFRCFMAISSLPQKLPCLVVTGDKGLVGTGLYQVISDACLHRCILHLKHLSECVIYVNGVMPPTDACCTNNGSGVLYVWRVINSVCVIGTVELFIV